MTGDVPTVVPRGKWIEQGVRFSWSLVCLGLVCWVVISAARQRASLLDFYPLNGDFQNFNPIRRWLSGEAPGRDFNAYLGLGPTGVMTLATALLGGDYRASLAAVTGLCVLFQAVAFWIAARCVGLSRTAAWSIAAISVLFTAAPYKLWMPRHLQAVLVGLSEHLLKPGNSVLGLRAAAPLLVALVLIALWRYWRPGSAALPRCLLLGIVGGCILPWSNDYGLTTSFAVGIVSAWCAYPDLRWRGWALVVAMQGLVTLLTAIVVVSVWTRGAPLEWFQSGFLGVAQDQFWYFDGRKLLSIEDVPFFPSLLVGTVCVGWWSVQSRSKPAVVTTTDDLTADRDRCRARLALLLVLTPFLAALLSMAGGHVGWRYTFPLTRMLYVFAPACAIQIVQTMARRWIYHKGVIDLHPLPVGSILEAALCVLLAVQVITLARRYRNELDHHPASVAPFQIEVPELRGQISSRFGPVLDIARELKAEYEASATPPHRRTVSTYTSLIDLVAGAATPTRADYLIHALGDRERGRYHTAFLERPPTHVITVRDDFDGWDGWLRRQNWALYRDLISNYDETDRTWYARIWSRRQSPRPPMQIPVAHRIVLQTESTVVLEFRLPASISKATGSSDIGAFDSGDILCEVVLEYATSARESLLGHGVLRQSLEAIEPERAFRIFGMATWGLPIGHHRRTFPMELSPGRSQLLILDLAPNEVSRLDLQQVACTALWSVRDVDDPPVRRLRTAHWTAGPWDRGIARPDAAPSGAGPDTAMFLASDLTDLRHLREGDDLRFAGSGVRRITAIQGSRVTVEGPALMGTDASRPIEVVNPVWRPHRRAEADLLLSTIQTRDWRNGICIDAGRAGCFVMDPHQIDGLQPGHRLEFAGSGLRRVTAVEQMLVWVDGPALDPALDGPPETVRWIDRPADQRPWRDWIRPVVRRGNE